MRENLEEVLLNSIAADGWRKVGIKQHHGCNIFLNALRSATSGGIGEFLDLLPMMAWCQKIGMDIIQLLPLNDSGIDPSPYNALSSCALNPIYLKLCALPFLDEYPHLQKKIEPLYAYNDLPRIAYSDVLQAKLDWLQSYFSHIFSALRDDPRFHHFKSAYPWVETYALFKILLEECDSLSWEMWPQEYRSLSAADRAALTLRYENEINFHTALQYFCFDQLTEVRKAAELCGIFLLGDIPILMSRNSADVWHAPQFFNLSFAAGAPPDDYANEGQYWGFPLFDWDALRQEDYRFWRERLHIAGHFYHLYRIDHAVGFFRIWAIPLFHLSKFGHFIPPEPDKWIPQGSHLLSMIAASSSMLPIAEDLGVVPPGVRVCLKEMGIPGTCVMRWELDRLHDPVFKPLDEYPPLSLSCLSTHDSETLGEWWQNMPDDAECLAEQKNWIYTPIITEQQRMALLWDSHHTSSLFHVNPLQEYFALFPELIAERDEEERINIPGTCLPTNWTYRYRPPIEIITSHEKLFLAMQSLLST